MFFTIPSRGIRPLCGSRSTSPGKVICVNELLQRSFPLRRSHHHPETSEEGGRDAAEAAAHPCSRRATLAGGISFLIPWNFQLTKLLEPALTSPHGEQKGKMEVFLVQTQMETSLWALQSTTMTQQTVGADGRLRCEAPWLLLGRLLGRLLSGSPSSRMG